MIVKKYADITTLVEDIYGCYGQRFWTTSSIYSWTELSRCYDVKGSVKFHERGEERGARERGARVSL